ncbi:protein transport protein Sec16B isoform X1 [Ictalurus punctatus]|uniref:Protein transport protein Sec16B isoform X1 n=1 Tax=Ictalurus punctatus TaxID=7998 RepID=A0A2D0RZ95_ICTPU|nr:protein transport protein Sec16B isoform X1 [Ictalurus punctatus]XP_053539615.1 protein transport protein Sec16B isoform X1 [Ictalurus punctatus]
MEPRGQNWNEQWPQNQRSDHRVRDEQYRSHHTGKQGHYPPADVRDSERRWYATDPRYMYYMSGPPAEFSTAYRSQTYTPDRAQSHSRQGYDYPPQSYWDYRNDYSYYDHGYYRGHYGYPAASDTSGRPVQGWRTEGHQEWSGATYTHQHGYELRRDSGQYEGGVPVRECVETRNEAREVSEPGCLESSKTSGLSSSTYELSQYINGDEQSNAPPPAHSEAETKLVVPLKFSVPHVALSFGPAGQLVRVTPALPSHGEPAQVEFHSLEVILSDTREQNDMRGFPGPLAREDLHKVDVINFALQMADACLKDETTFKPSSASLLWHLLVLLCRQNGRIVGSDIAELLLQGSRSVGACDEDGKQSDVGSLIDLNETPSSEMESFNTSDFLTGNVLSNEETSEQSIQNYTKLLLAGRKKEALESAMRSGLWGHALFLASKMDSRAYNTVLSRFTGSLSPSDPLQTLFQLLSGRIPAVAMSYSKEKWGDWRPHLAVILSNETGDSALHYKSIVNLGDILASRGLLHAAHICYLTARTPFGWYTNKTQHLVLLSSSHSASFADFCHNSAIRCTEVFEYCQRLGNPSFIIPSFLVYKFLYACRLLDCGLFSQAFHYCELVAKALLTIQEPHIILLQEVIKMVDRLKHSETQICVTGADPDWLSLLRQRLRDLQMGNFGSNGLYMSAAEGTAWDQEENRECADLNRDELSTSEMIHTSLIEDSHNSSGNVHYNQSQFATHPHSSYPSDVQSYTTYSLAEHSYMSYPSEEGSYIPETQTCAPKEQVPQIYAPVPMYSQQNLVSSELPPIHAVQDGVTHSDTTYHQTVSSLDPRSSNNTDGDFSTGKNMMGAPENGSALGSADLGITTPTKANRKETTSQKSETEPKSGWFSGWFKSKPKETPEDQYEQTKPALMESTPIPPFPAPPKVSSTMLPSQTQAASINPFSRRAGQKPGAAVGQSP